MTRHLGFTLAEVLITLGIIGVVAAMTMPTLMNSTNGAQYKTAYKKALSVLSQAVVLNVALDDYDMSEATTTATTPTTSASLFNMFNNRMNVVKPDYGTEGKGGWTADVDSIKFGAGSGNYTLFFNDGITFTFPNSAAKCAEADSRDTTGSTEDSGFCYGVIDVNGEKHPNQVIACDGKAWNAENVTDCEIKQNPTTDIYPVVMYDQTILPSTEAGRAVLYGGK